MLNVGLLVYAGFQPLGLAVGSVFEYANAMAEVPTYACMLVSVTGGLVPTSQGYSVETKPLEGQSFDTLIVLGDNDCAAPPEALVRYLRDAPAHVRRVTAACTGAFVLAAAGLLDGRRATTHWAFVRGLQEAYPQAMVEGDRIFVIDGQIWTSAGMSAGIDLALALVEKDVGEEVARAIARKFVLYHRRGGGQSQFSALLDLNPRSDRVQTALDHVRQHLKDDLPIEVLAGIASLSPRQFSRVFREETGQSPAKAIERLRVEAARVMMETTRLPVETVARETGFGDRERMRNSFLRAFGIPPQAIQRLSGGQELVTRS